MAEDQNNDQDKTEDPTPRRRQEAREEGNVAKSQDLAAAVILLSLPLLFWVLGPHMLASLTRIYRRFLGTELMEVTGDTLMISSADLVKQLVVGIVPLFLIVAVVAFLGNVLQVGFLFAPKKL
ncbi:MAG: EscU/YscU/HrcU family type III secretion system export apparatus switch protein, partial [Planctomycetota bacterium]